MSASAPTFDIVIPTTGRPSVGRVLDSLGAAAGTLPGAIFVVDDRAGTHTDLELNPPRRLQQRVAVLRCGRGPAAARNTGWRASQADWVIFLDDDVVLPPDWLVQLEHDLGAAAPRVAGVQGRIRVPLPVTRRPTDWERNVAGLERARWASADIAYRRADLARAGGFDERFPRAYREDADLALRMMDLGRRMVAGSRHVLHPVGPRGPWVSVRKQTGNMDDALMLRLHGRRWRERAQVPRGRRPAHVAVTLFAAAAVGAGLLRRRSLAAPAAAAWLAATAELAVRRIAPGPRDAREVATMALTSAMIPIAAAAWWTAGLVRWRHARPLDPSDDVARARPDAVLLDRDGTLVVNVPYNGDPELVEPMPGAREAVARLRSAGVSLAVVSNQSGIGRGLVTGDQVAAVNRRIEELLGPIEHWALCPHHPGDGCECRKPRAGLLKQAARELGVHPARCAVVGDIGADVEAARAVGARSVLVPTPETLPEEVRDAPEVARDLPAAVELLIGRGSP